MDSAYLASFGDIEDRHWWFRARREIVLDQLRLLHLPDDIDVLDVGCGTGGTLAFLTHALPHAHCRGIEPDPAARACCETRGLNVIEGTAIPLPVASGSQDVVTAFDMLEHLDDDVAGMREIVRALRPGGIALITVPAYRWMWGPHDEINQHRRRYLRNEVERLVKDAGLTIERSTYFNTLLFPLAVIQRTAERLSGRHFTTERAPFGPLNAVFYRLFALERPLLRRLRFPWGVSILVVGRKPRVCVG